MSELLAAVATWAIHIGVAAAIALPLVVLTTRVRTPAPTTPGAPAASEHSGPDVRAAALAAIAMLVVWVIVFAVPHIGPFAGIAPHWQANSLGIAVCVAVMLGVPGLSPHRVGLGAPSSGAWRPVITIGLGAIILQVIIGPMMGPTLPTVENIAFQLTVSNVFEELWFRGVLWALVAAAVPGAVRIGRVRASGALIVTSVIFGLVHGVVVHPDEGLALDVVYVLASGVAGVVLGWLREQAGSIWPPVVLHTIINVSGMIIAGVQA